jgi:hypothetical protein
MKTIKISRDYSNTPGPRYIKQGKYSGEDFRNTLLEKEFLNSEKLIIDLDGVFGYSASFLDEAFGGLARKYPNEDFDKIAFICKDNPVWIEEIKTYIKDGIKEGKENDK